MAVGNVGCVAHGGFNGNYIDMTKIHFYLSVHGKLLETGRMPEVRQCSQGETQTLELQLISLSI